jgi:mannosyltransferase
MREAASDPARPERGCGTREGTSVSVVAMIVEAVRRRPPDRAETSDPIGLRVAIVVVIAVAIALRFLCRSDLWLDEALTVNVARLPVRQIGPWLRHDGAPPLYYWMMHYWIRVFGNSHMAVRSLSGVFSVATLPLAYFCGKRVGGRRTAWITVLVLATSPYAFLYATTVRMYSLEAFLVFAGILAVRRAFDRPSLGRVALVGALSALLLYTQYWGLYALAALGLFLLATVRRSPDHRVAAGRLLVAVVAGAATFAPWLPTFLYQAKHTGTPWGKPALPPTPIGQTLQDFSGGITHEGWMLLIAFVVLVFLGTFATPSSPGHIEVDFHGRGEIRGEALIGAATLVIGTSAAWAARSAFEPRYASVVFPFFVLLIARGITCFAARAVRASIVVFVVLLGFVGGVHNVDLVRTSAGDVAAILRHDAKPGDVVLYCPDQVAPAVHRLAPPGLDEVTYPRLLRPALIDWVDYTKVLRQHKPAAVAQEILARAGSHTIWYVWAPGYLTHVGVCDAVSNALAQARPLVLRLAPNLTANERPGLKQFSAP